jgi:hypothetical protein
MSCNDIKWLHIIFLENQKIIFHVSPQLSENDLFMECILMYEFVQENKPIRLYDTVEYISRLETDYQVKQFMKQYGIDNVRGGTYTANHLASYHYKSLMDELDDTNFEELQNTISMIKKIHQKYDNQTIPFETEKKNLLKSLEKYRERKTNYKNLLTLLSISTLYVANEKHTSENPNMKDLSLCFKDEEMYDSVTTSKIRRQEMNELFEWIYARLSKEENGEQESQNKIKRHSLVYCQKYKSFISFCKKLVHVSNIPEWKEIIEISPPNPNLSIYIQYPEFIFDLFFYHSGLDEKNKYIKQYQFSIDCFEYFEYIKNVLFNLLDDYEYEIFSISPYFEIETHIAVEYIDFIVSDKGS